MLYQITTNVYDSGGVYKHSYAFLVEANDTAQAQLVYDLMQKRNGGFWDEPCKILKPHVYHADEYLKGG